MKIKPKHRSKKLLLTLGVICTLLLGGLGYWVYINQNGSQPADGSSEIDYNSPSDEQIDAGNDAKQQTIEDDLASRDDPKLNPQDTEAGDDVAIHITAASVEGDTLYIRTEIEGIYSEGSCKLTLTKNDVTVMKSAGVQPLPKSTTCKGFNIPVSELSRGTWAIEVQASVSGSSASAKGSVEV